MLLSHSQVEKIKHVFLLLFFREGQFFIGMFGVSLSLSLFEKYITKKLKAFVYKFSRGNN